MLNKSIGSMIAVTALALSSAAMFSTQAQADTSSTTFHCVR